MNRKILAILAGILMLAVVMAGCKGGSKETQPQTETTETEAAFHQELERDLPEDWTQSSQEEIADEETTVATEETQGKLHGSDAQIPEETQKTESPGTNTAPVGGGGPNELEERE